jgi:hypothetical protein
MQTLLFLKPLHKARRVLLPSLKFTPVERNSLFFGQYRYSVRFALTELGVIRGLKLYKIDEIVRNRNEWRAQHQGIYSAYRNLIGPDEIENLKTVCRALKKYETQIKFVISYDHGYVYTNDVKLVQKIQNLDCIKNFQALEAMEVCPPGTLALKNPKWSHRTYFRSVNLTEHQKITLRDYLNNRENIRLSPGLKFWLEHDQYWGNYTQGYFFFDHNNDGETLFINMVVPRITGRTLQIVAK